METIFWKPWTAESRRGQVCSAPEVITTFRKGAKWLRAEIVGQRVRLVDEKDKRLFATGRVRSVKLCLWRDIEELDHARQSSDMVPERRLDVMRSVYGEYDEDTPTCVVTLDHIKPAPGACD